MADDDAWDQELEEQEWSWPFFQEDIETVGQAPRETTSGPEGPWVETASPEGVVSPARLSIDPALIAISRDQTTVLWARQHFTPAASLHRNAEEDLLLSRGMEALSLDPGTLLGTGIQDGHDVIRIGVSSANYVGSPERTHEFIVEIAARGGVPVGITVTDSDSVRSVKSFLKPTPPKVLSLDLLGAQVGNMEKDNQGRQITANRRLMDDNETAVKSILVRDEERVELQQQVADGLPFTQGTFSRRAATPRLAEQVWGETAAAPDTNLPALERSSPQHTPPAKKPRLDPGDDPTAGSTIDQAEGVTGERQQTAAQPAAPAPGGRVTGRLSKEDENIIEDRMDVGSSLTEIANDLNRALPTMHHAIKRLRARQAAEGLATGPLSAKDMETIRARMDNDTPEAIAKHLNRRPGTVRYAIERLQGEATGKQPTGRLSAEEEKFISDRMGNHKPAHIARLLKRPPDTVYSAIQRLRKDAAGGRATGRLSADEKEFIRRRMGDKPTNIARDLIRPASTVHKAIKRFQTGAEATNDPLVESDDDDSHRH
ncbi:hypothetical protein ACCS93_38210 [Rhizobium ruizarguesonis]